MYFIFLIFRNFSNEIAHEIDKEMRKIIDECHTKATKIMKSNKKLLDLIATTLVEKETLSKEEIDYLVEHNSLYGYELDSGGREMLL